jgi:hypothetical protein
MVIKLNLLEREVFRSVFWGDEPFGYLKEGAGVDRALNCSGDRSKSIPAASARIDLIHDQVVFGMVISPESQSTCNPPDFLQDRSELWCYRLQLCERFWIIVDVLQVLHIKHCLKAVYQMSRIGNNLKISFIITRMTELLERAITRLKTLTIEEQNAIAAMILEELEEEQRWDDSFARSPDLLAALAAEAMDEFQAGKTQELDPETL